MEKRVLFGWIYLIIGALPFLTFILFGNAHFSVWFSNHTFIIMGLALLFRSQFWAFAELCIGFLPELVWSLDFLAKPIIGQHIWGFTSYMFKNGAFDWFHLYSFQHILFVPAALYAVYLLGGPVKQAWLGSLAHLVVLFGVSSGFPWDFNINCVNYKCIFDLPFYQISWPLLMITHAFVVYFLVMAVWKRKKKKK